MRVIREEASFYITGILILTLGIALTIQSRLGASPFDALLVGLYRTFGATVGTWEIVVGLTMVIGNALAQRCRPEYSALITSFITGMGIDFWLFSLRNWLIPTTITEQFICLFFGMLFTGIGVATYLQSKIAPNPMDRSMLIITDLTGWGVTYSRALISIILVIAAFVFGGAIGIGTLLNALLSGVLINYFLPHARTCKRKLQQRVRKLAS